MHVRIVSGTARECHLCVNPAISHYFESPDQETNACLEAMQNSKFQDHITIRSGVDG